MRRLIHIIFVAGLATAALGGSASAQDLRSADARAAARAATPAVIDMRSPDARATTGVPTFEPSVVAPPQVVRVSEDGFQWGDAGIGAAATLGLIALCGGLLLLLTNRRREQRVPRPVG